MQPFNRLDAIAAPLMRDNVDTDMIVRVERLVALRRGEFGPYIFESLRYGPDGEEDPDFILNRSGYRQARILVAGTNFGCGSSRESAVWSLADFGFRCVIAPSFGEIFQTNCIQNGLLPVTLCRAEVERIAEAVEPGVPDARLTVDLEACVISLPNGEGIRFEIDTRSREMLLKGQDAISMTLQDIADIEAYQLRDRTARRWIYEF